MANLSGFDASQVDPLPDREPIPSGRYVAVIVGSEMKPTKAGTGNYLELVFEIIEGEHEKRRLWTRLNLDNPNPQAVQIAQAELATICRAVGVLAPSDSSELHDVPLEIRVGCVKRADNGEIANEIKGYSKREETAEVPQVADADSTPPWKR